MNSPYKQDYEERASQLLLAARTCITLFETMHALMWDLYPEQIIGIKQEQRQHISEMLAMAMVDEAWPPEKQLDLGFEDWDEELQHDVANKKVVNTA